MRTSSPDIYTCLSQGPDLATLRQTLFDTLFDSLLDQATGQTGTSHPPGKSPAKVTTDAVTDDAPQLCQEVGLDTLTLALLADVPIHRPLHLSHNNLIGQWRWLRQVWRVCAPLPPVAVATPTAPPKPQADMIAALVQGRNNTAIALLRQSFQPFASDGDGKTGICLQTFLANLTVFCPFIGTELLWRQGMVTASKDKGMIE